MAADGIENFHKERKAHGEIKIPTRHMKARAFCDERHADKDDERQGQDLGGGPPLDEGRHRTCCQHHEYC